MSLRVGVFAEPIIQQQAGIHQYTKQMITALEEYGSLEYTLYCSEAVKSSLSQEIKAYFGRSLRNPLRWMSLEKDISRQVDYFIDPSHFGSLGLVKHPKRISIVHDLTPLLFPAYHTFTTVLGHRWLMKRWIASSHIVITPSEQTANDIRQTFGTQRPINVIYPGTDMEPSGEQNTYKPRAPYFLMVGSIEPRKNHRRVIEALEQLNHPNIELVIAGPEGWKLNLRSEIAKSPVGHRVRWLGKVSRNHLADLYQHATALVYPSFYEGFGLPILEAMSLGCPVITSDLGAMKEIARDAALLIDPDRSDQIALVMNSLLEEETLRKKLIQRGQIRSLDFTWKHFVNQLEASLVAGFSD